jgi:hypothetical protein
VCEWAGCQNKGPHRAPKGRENSREYFHFCLNHVREYNQNYNFFQGMNADAVARYQKDALTGHRPTWKMGANTAGKKGKQAAEDFEGAADPFSMFSELNGRGRWRPGPGGEAKAETRKVMNAERKAAGDGPYRRNPRGQAIQGAGQAAPSRRHAATAHRGPPDRDHQGV